MRRLFLLSLITLGMIWSANQDAGARSANQNTTTTDTLATTTTAAQGSDGRPVRMVSPDTWVLFNVELAPFCPAQPPREGNAAAYYVEALKIWLELSSKLDEETRNSPELLEKMPEMLKAINLVEQGAERRYCNFYEFYPFSPSAYHQETPDSVGTLMLAKLLIRRSERLQEAKRFGEALRPAKCCVIFGSHLYYTAEKHNQATNALQIMTVGFTLIHEVFTEIDPGPVAQFAAQLQTYFRKIFDDHMIANTSLRYGVPDNIKSVLEALESPVPAVRCEGLRILGNVVDPSVKITYLADPNYLILRQRMTQLYPEVTQLMSAMQSDSDPRVALLAYELSSLLGQREAMQATMDNQQTTSKTMTVLQQALNFSLTEFLKKIKK